MFAWKTSKGNKVRLIKIGVTNCYLIEYENINILVDTGQKRFESKLLFVLRSLFNNKKLDYLVLTHTHYDHTQNARIVHEEFNPKVIVHKNEYEFLRSGFTTFPKGTNLITFIISALGNKYAKGIGEYDAVNADILVNGEYLIENKPGLKLIETQGHTSGSISLVIDDEIAIVGDTLIGIFSKKVFPPFANNKAELFISWRKLLKESCNIFLPAHGRLIRREILITESKKHT